MGKEQTSDPYAFMQQSHAQPDPKSSSCRLRKAFFKRVKRTKCLHQWL